MSRWKKRTFVEQGHMRVALRVRIRYVSRLTVSPWKISMFFVCILLVLCFGGVLFVWFVCFVCFLTFTEISLV